MERMTRYHRILGRPVIPWDAFPAGGPEIDKPEEPNGCRWCGYGRRGHYGFWRAPAGWHTWVEPTDEQRLRRMRARRGMRNL